MNSADKAILDEYRSKCTQLDAKLNSTLNELQLNNPNIVVYELWKSGKVVHYTFNEKHAARHMRPTCSHNPRVEEKKLKNLSIANIRILMGLN
jgi:hypothetical protein